MKSVLLSVALILGFASAVFAQGVPDEVDPAVAAEKGCLSCHEGIEDFTQGVMMETIQAMGPDYGDPDGCVVCHGGTPTGTVIRNQGSVDSDQTVPEPTDWDGVDEEIDNF